MGPAETISEVRIDANGDRVPDRMGDTVTVAGRVTAGRGRLSVPVPEIAVIQDSTAGIHVLLPEGPPVERGDSVRLRGVVDQAYGLTRLQGLDYQIVDAPKRVPPPLPLTVTAATGEHYEGRLARVRGRVASKGSNDGGDFLVLNDPNGEVSSQLSVFVANRHKGRVRLGQFEEGDEIEVTGVLGQHDFSAPYTDYYQVEPRTQSDLASVGGMSTFLRTTIFVLAGGGLLAVVAVFVLQAAVRRRTEELDESRARFQRLAEATFEGIALHKADGKIIDANTALADMVGMDRDELIGQDVSAVLPETTSDAAQEVGGNADAPTEAEIVHEDGTTTPVEIEARVVTAGEETVHVRAIRDISKRKEWENEILLAKREAEEMAQLKSTLLNNMSHELRTPITNITGYAELIVDEAEGTHEKFAAQICKSGKRLSETLQSVLDMAQIEAGTLDVLVREVAVANVVREVIDRHDQKIDDEVLTVEVDVPNEFTLETDRTLLSRIFNNLIHNAIKFTEQGTIGVEVTPIDDGIQIRVWDTGVGIASEFRPHLFEPFKQESEGLAREYEGAGLGLTLTKHMVDILEGTIEVESTKGEGSVFIIELPSLSMAETPVVAPDEQGASR
jgi:two-component system sensor histidine kinase BarA